MKRIRVLAGLTALALAASLAGCGGAASAPDTGQPHRQLEPDGGAAHGTGLKLVSQIAAAHGGEARFYGGDVFRCELWLPSAS